MNGPSKPSAVIYCEGNFGKVDGKTANGLIHRSDAYRILSVIDSSKAGTDSGSDLFGHANDIPVVRNISEALNLNDLKPEVFIYGLAPANGRLSQRDRDVITHVISQGLDVVCGLHEFLSEDVTFIELATKNDVTIYDVRKPKPNHELRVFDGSVGLVEAKRIVVMGTDCAIGKRTTATILDNSLNSQRVKTTLIATGQTGLMQGARYGVVMDALPSQFCAGELESCITRAAKECELDVILVEGQGALSHPAFCTSALILRGSQPNGVILQHAPKRQYRCDFPSMCVPELADEILMIESFSNTKVIGITINHEYMSDAEVKYAILKYRDTFGLPVLDPLRSSQETLAALVIDSFSDLKLSLTN